MRVVFFNGPPLSGKSTAARLLAPMLRARDCRAAYELLVVHLADEPKAMVHRAYEVDGEDLPEEDKDKAMPDLLGATPRQAYVAFIQGLIAIHGHGILGRMLLRKFKSKSIKWLLVSDLGRMGDMHAFRECYGNEACCVVRMHRLGCDYSGDTTRGYVVKSGLREFDLINDGDQSRLKSTLEHMLLEEPWFANEL